MDADKTNNTEMAGLTIAELDSTLVCCLMTSLDAPMQVSTMLRKEMFSDKSLGFVFGVIMDLYDHGVQPDMVTVETGMRRLDEVRWKELNGLSFLLPAMLNVRNAENVIRYAEEVKRQYKLRCLIREIRCRSRQADCGSGTVVAGASARHCRGKSDAYGRRIGGGSFTMA